MVVELAPGWAAFRRVCLGTTSTTTLDRHPLLRAAVKAATPRTPAAIKEKFGIKEKLVGMRGQLFLDP